MNEEDSCDRLRQTLTELNRKIESLQAEVEELSADSTEVIVTSANMTAQHLTKTPDDLNHDTVCMNTMSNQEFKKIFIEKLNKICRYTLDW